MATHACIDTGGAAPGQARPVTMLPIDQPPPKDIWDQMTEAQRQNWLNASAAQWKLDWKARRKENMTRRARAADTAKRVAAARMGRGARCRRCRLHLTEEQLKDHYCGYGRTPAPNQTPPGGPPPPAAPPAPGGASNGAAPKPPAQPATGPTNNSKGGRTVANGGGGGSTGTGNSAQHAANLIQVMQAFANDIPQSNTELGVMCQAMTQAWVAMGQLITEYANRLVNMPPGPEGEPRGFHPSCVAPLMGVAARMTEGSAGWMEMYAAVQNFYRAQIDMHRSGVPVPSAKFLGS